MLALVLVAFVIGLATTVVAVLLFVNVTAWGPDGVVQVQQLLGQPADRWRLLIFTVVGLLAFTVGLAVLATRPVLLPLRRLTDAADRMARGDLHIRLPASGADELGDLVRSFNDMAAALGRTVDELRRLEERSRRFAADVSHELRTPLTAMTAVAELLEDEADRLPANAAGAARLVSRETRNLNVLVEDLMEISRFDAGTAALRLDDVDVVTATRDCLARRGSTGQIEVTASPALVVRLDPRRFDVIVANLVGNALRHGAPPVTVQIRNEIREGRPWLVLTVADRGAGVPSDVLPRVFDRFFKADAARARSEGSGLGLAIAAENARLHGGSLTVTNRPDGGALFTLSIPVADDT